jgi:hypothetical protein
MRFLIFSLLLSCLLCGQGASAQNNGASSAQQTTQFDEKLLLGTWKVVSVSGKVVTKEMTMTFKSDYTYLQTKKNADGTINSRFGSWKLGRNLQNLEFMHRNQEGDTVVITHLDKERLVFKDDRNTFELKNIASALPQTTQFDEKLLLGTWKVVSVSGQVVNYEMTITFKSDYTFEQTKKKANGTNASRAGTWAFGKDLKSIDFTPENQKTDVIQIVALNEKELIFTDIKNKFVLKKVE